MAQPTKSSLHISAALKNVSIAYRNAGYIAESAFARVPVEKQSDYFYTYTKGDWFRDEADLQGPGARAPRGGYTISNTAYSTQRWAFATPVPDANRENADSNFKLDAEAVEFSTDKVLLKLERKAAAAIFVASTWHSGSDYSVPTAWDTFSTSDPLNDLQIMIRTVQTDTGVRPNTLIMGGQVWDEGVVNHPDFLDRIKYTQTGVVTEDLVASLLAAKGQPFNVQVGRAVYNSAKEGATVSMADVWGTSIWVGYVPPAPGLRVPAAGYTFWKNGGGPEAVQLSKWREEAEHQDVYEAAAEFIVKRTGVDLAYYAASVVS